MGKSKQINGGEKPRANILAAARLDAAEELELAKLIPELVEETGLGLRSIKRQLERKRSGGPYVPTFEDRALVAIWAAVGTDQATIATELGISIPTLVKHFPAELEDAERRGVARAGTRLYASMMAGEAWAITFYLKTRGRWRETDKAPGSDADNPLHIQLSTVQQMAREFRGIKQAKALGKEPPVIEHAPQRSIEQDIADVL